MSYILRQLRLLEMGMRYHFGSICISGVSQVTFHVANKVSKLETAGGYELFNEAYSWLAVPTASSAGGGMGSYDAIGFTAIRVNPECPGRPPPVGWVGAPP